MKRLVIIGSGPAGLTVAETVRQEDRESAITILSAEPFAPYSPPALGDHFRTGERELLFWKGEDACTRLGIDERREATVSSIDTEGRRVLLADGSAIGFDRLVIASGSRLYAPIPGNDMPGVHNFKSLRSASSLVERARHREAHSVLVVGGGFIGIEIALLMASLGLEVTVLEMRPWLMSRILDQETAGIVAAAVEAQGVSLRLGVQAEAFCGDGEARGVRLPGGEELDADIVIAATGVKPQVEFVEGSGIEVGWGVRVDDRLSSSLPGIFACGDAAETFDRLSGERYVHAIFPNAVAQGRIVGYELLGYPTRYEGAEAMNSLKHLGFPVMAVGSSDGADQVRWRDGERLRKLFLDQAGRLVGFQLVGDVSGAGFYRSLMLRRIDVGRFGERLVRPGWGEGYLALETGVRWPARLPRS